MLDRLAGRFEDCFSLKYADDIVLFAYSQEELQASLDRLFAFSAEFELVVNVKKSKCMVFRGHSPVPTVLSVFVNGEPLEQVPKFVYLGFCFEDTLSLTRSAEEVTKKVAGSYYSFLNKLAGLRAELPLKIAEHMFEATVVSVANFGAEVYGANPAVDIYQLKFFRSLFDLHPRLPTDALYALTGYFPLHFRHLALQFGFLKKILKRLPESLIYRSLIITIQTAKRRKTSWLR